MELTDYQIFGINGIKRRGNFAQRIEEDRGGLKRKAADVGVRNKKGEPFQDSPSLNSVNLENLVIP
jgi:hypothetical protein